MTPAQLAQQNNRDTGGRYREAPGADQGDEALASSMDAPRRDSFIVHGDDQVYAGAWVRLPGAQTRADVPPPLEWKTDHPAAWSGPGVGDPEDLDTDFDAQDLSKLMNGDPGPFTAETAPDGYGVILRGSKDSMAFTSREAMTFAARSVHLDRQYVPAGQIANLPPFTVIKGMPLGRKSIHSRDTVDFIVVGGGKVRRHWDGVPEGPRLDPAKTFPDGCEVYYQDSKADIRWQKRWNMGTSLLRGLWG